MAGILERMRRSRRRVVKPCVPLDVIPPKALELQTAKEILAETFGVSLREVEEMLRQRCEEREEWPERFWTGVE
jgi:hypothetical protein